PSIHVIVGMSAGQAPDYLVGVHIRGGAAAGLEDVDRELTVVVPFHNLFGRSFDSGRESRRKMAQAAVYVCRDALDQSQRSNKGSRETLAADRKVLDGSCRLRPVKCRDRYSHVPHGVALDSERIHHDSIVTLYRGT